MAVEVLNKPAEALSARERMELVLSEVDQLPTLPAVASRLLAITSSDDSCAADVIDVIEADPSLTAAVLRLVRRADMGVGNQAISVSRAVVLLGFTVIRNLVLSIHVFEALAQRDGGGKGLSYRDDIWRNSLATACMAELLAERLKDRELAGHAFVCGLLHDIGKIALDACLPKSYAKVIAEVQRERACINEVEQRLLGVDHTVAGKRLAQRWHLPDAVMECIWLHHQPPDALPASLSSRRLIRLVHLADNLVRLQGIGLSGSSSFSDVDELVSGMDLDEAAPTEVMSRLPERMQPFLELLGLSGPETAVCSREALIEANRELGRMNTRLREGQRSMERSARCLGVLHDFANRLTQHARTADVCVAAAEAVRSYLESDRAMAFCWNVSQSWVRVGHVVGHGAQWEVGAVEAGAAAEVGALQRAVEAAAGVGLTGAPEACEELWQRRGLPRGDAPLWLLRVESECPSVSAVLVEADETSVRRCRTACDEWEALATTFRLALGWARARTDSEQMNEELMDLNRRLREAQQRLVQSRSMSMISEMAAGAAHELNSPLSVISGRSQLLRSSVTDPEQQRALEIIVEQTKRAAGIVTELMSFAKPEPPNPVSECLGSVLESLCQHWRAASHLGGEQVVLSLAEPAVTVHADPAQLREILTAVVANAIGAMKPERARLEINSTSRLSDETVRIAVKDNGVGMSREVLEHALDPFFSSRQAGRGRGLGLSRAYRLAEINGGRLWLESTPGHGTTVTIELPARPPEE